MQQQQQQRQQEQQQQQRNKETLMRFLIIIGQVKVRQPLGKQKSAEKKITFCHWRRRPDRCFYVTVANMSVGSARG